MYYSAIGILAAMILVIENHDILLNRNRTFEQPAWKVYRKFLFAILAYYASDILWGVFEAFHMPGALFADTAEMPGAAKKRRESFEAEQMNLSRAVRTKSAMLCQRDMLQKRKAGA